jgi:serine/threonine protein kinase
MPLEPGARLGPYEITGPLGAGGMGEVYRAKDTRLGREVALKILFPDVAHDPQRRMRFEHEARAVAALNHPHIVTVYSIEEAGGQRFLAMELVVGAPLSKRIPDDGMDPGLALDLAVQLTEALAAVHHKGITHRDLKPANIASQPIWPANSLTPNLKCER